MITLKQLLPAVFDPSGKSLSYQYDDKSNLTKVIERDSTETKFTYNNQHGLLDIIDTLGHDKFNGNRKTNILTVIVNEKGELLSTFPGKLK